MIPHIIELKNFLSYGETVQTIDFKNYDLICLSGKNGNGKSALLDALTWALWGQARKITGASKADEGLLRLGQTRMMVCVQFEFGQQIYRVRREFAKTYGKPYSALDFEIYDSTRKTYASLTDKTVRATQEKIESLLGLDYETFINTSFLRQGQANEFSKKSPKERKQILATILGFSKYDLLQQQALETMKQLTEEKKLLTQLINQSKQELDLEPLITEQLKLERLTADKINQNIQTITHTLRNKEQEKTISTQLKDIIIAWKSVHKTTLLLPNLKELEDKKRILANQEKLFLELRQKNITIQEQELILKQQLQQCQASLTMELDKNIYIKRIDLEKQHVFLQQQIIPLEQKQKLLKELAQKHTQLTTDLYNIQKTKIALEENLSSYQTNKKQFEKRRAFYQALVPKGNWLKNALQESDHKKRIVEDLSNPACPLCEQMLTAKRKQFLGAKLITHEYFLRHQINRVSTIIKRLKELLLEQHKIIEQQEKDLEILRQHTEQERLLTSTLTDISPACDLLVVQIVDLQKQLEVGNQSYEHNKLLLHQMEKEGLVIIAQNTEIKNLTQQLTALEKEKNTHQYDQEAYCLLQEDIKKIEHAINNIANLNTQREQQTMRRAHIHHLVIELKELKKTPTYQDTRTIESLKKELTTITEEKEQNTRRQARLENDLHRIEKIKTTSATKFIEIVKLDQEIDDYQTLAQALSKNGIQALLIEEAIPEIEQEANALLAKLTDNQAQIFIESLRDLKSGGVKESLDIHISDASGIRPYEMYSGGEAFRIDFALRIAISKLLAQRAGTALQTLIIDEGFGSQDEEGLARITESLYSIKNDFAKIIIVSHLPEMKDSFPVHFIVDKQASGSVVVIEERG